MKRIVFCFDGTWERLDTKYPTNVVITAECILPSDKDGTVQIIHYDQGVGTTKQLHPCAIADGNGDAPAENAFCCVSQPERCGHQE